MNLHLVTTNGKAQTPSRIRSSDEPLYFDDLKIGDMFSTRTQEVSALDIKKFAAEFDPQPFHLDEPAASCSIFGGLAASGWHTAALTMRLLVADAPRLVGGIVGIAVDIEWKRPTRPGDVLRVEGEVVALSPSRSRRDRGIAILRNRTVNQREEVVQILTASLVVPRRQG